MSVTARVYQSASPGTLIAALPESRDRKWLHQLNETGSGELAVHADDTIFSTSPAILGYGNIVRFAIDGTDRFAFIIESRNIDPAPTTEKAGRYKRISGRGVLALLEDAVVYPEAGYTGSTARQRAFDFTSIAYDDTAWTSPVGIQTVGTKANTQLIRAWQLKPPGWERPSPTNVRWIWGEMPTGTPLVNMQSPAGKNYFRKSFTASAQCYVVIYCTCDNTCKIWFDGELILEGEHGAEETYAIGRIISAGTHQIAAEVTNDVLIGTGENPGGLALVVREDDDVGAISGRYVVTNDFSGWKVLNYPAAVPGMSLGEIMRILLEEAQTRGALTGITWTFTDSLDSLGSAWAENPDITLDIGMNYLDVFRILVEQYVDIEMTPALVLKAYNKGTLGTNLTGTVNLQVGVDFEEASGAGEDHSANVLLARDATGLLTQKTDAASVAARKRREAYLETAIAPNEIRAQDIADEVLDEFAQPSFQLACKVIKGSGPYTTWDPGDTILMPNPAGVATAATVLSIAVEEDEAGHEVFNVEAVMLDATS